MNARQIAFIDTAIADYQALVASIDPEIEVVLISDGDGLQQMMDALAGRSGIDAIHIVSHGSAGALQLGDTTLSNDNLNTYANQLARIGQSLSSEGDLLLYGCNVGAGVAGQSLLASIACITQADVAASNDLTGAANQGGDWMLEASVGKVEALSLLLPDYDHVLDAHSYSSASDSSLDVSGDDDPVRISVDNTGTGTVTVTGMPVTGFLEITGSGDVNVAAADSASLENLGTGRLTVTNSVENNAFTMDGSGPFTVITTNASSTITFSRDCNLTIEGDGDASISIQGITGGTITNVATNTVRGTTYVANPTGNLTVYNNGARLLNFIDLDAASGAVKITYSGKGQTFIEGALALGSDDNTSITLTGNGAKVISVLQGESESAGTVSLDNTPLTLSLAANYTPQVGDIITLIDNDGAGEDDAVTGTFAGKAGGATVQVGDYEFTISYAGGDGNDVTLTMSGALADSTPPTFDVAPAASNVTSTLLDLSASLNEGGTIYYVVVADGAVAPTVAEIKAGQASGGGAALKAGNSEVGTTPFTGTFNITGLTAGTAYHVYVVAQDDEGTPNVMAAATKVDVSTTAASNNPPAGGVTISGTATEDQTLTADTSNLTDADGLGTLSYQWLREGVAINGATNSTYTLGDTDVGKKISVEVSYTDGQGTAEKVTSAETLAVINVNDAPTINNVPELTQSVTVGLAAALNDFTVTDLDGADVPLTVTLTATNGTINGLTDADNTATGIQLTGTAAEINTVLASATFTAAAAGAASIQITAGDGVVASPTVATYNFTAVPVGAGAGAHHALVNGEVFLGGRYIEIGLSNMGSFGTQGTKPDDFFGTIRTLVDEDGEPYLEGADAIGLSNDADGFGIGKDLRIDYLSHPGRS